MKKVLSFILICSLLWITPVKSQAYLRDFSYNDDSKGIVAISNKVFRPRGGRKLSITVKSEEFKNSTIDIVTGKNKLVKRIGKSDIFSSHTTVKWDGKNSRGRIVSDGTYKVRLKVGNKKYYKKFKVRRKPKGGALRNSKIGSFNGSGFSFEFPSNWVINSSITDIVIRSPRTNKPASRCSIVFRLFDFTSLGMEDSAIMDEMIENYQTENLYQIRGKNIGVEDSSIDSTPAKVVKGEMRTEYMDMVTEYGEINFMASYNNILAVKNGICYDVSIAFPKGNNSHEANIDKILNSLKLKDVEPMKNPPQLQYSGDITYEKMTVTLTGKIFANIFDYGDGDIDFYFEYGTPINSNPDFYLYMYVDDWNEYTYETSALMVKDEIYSYLQSYGFAVEAQVRDIEVGGRECKEISASVNDTSRKVAVDYKVYLYSHNNVLYYIESIINMNEDTYNADLLSEMITQRDALMNSVKIPS